MADSYSGNNGVPAQGANAPAQPVVPSEIDKTQVAEGVSVMDAAASAAAEGAVEAVEAGAEVQAGAETAAETSAEAAAESASAEAAAALGAQTVESTETPDAASEVDHVKDAGSKAATQSEAAEAAAPKDDVDKGAAKAAKSTKADKPETTKDSAKPAKADALKDTPEAASKKPAPRPAAKDDAPTKEPLKVGIPVLVVALVVVAIIAALLGSCISGRAHSTQPLLSEGQLDDVVATYTYKGSTHDVTAREAIESQYGIAQAQNSEGTYAAPSSENVIRHVRNLIICEDAAAQGVTPTDKEMAAYAKQTLGSDDYGTIAKMYGVDEEQARRIVEVACTVNKMSEKVSADAPKAPEAPAQPKDGKESKATKAYGEYIANLLGDEWNTDKDEWARTDGKLYELLSQRELSTKEASYEQASSVYQAAFSVYSVEFAEGRHSWNDYMNDLFKEASIDLYGLYL